jgi:hypothetical protein
LNIRLHSDQCIHSRMCNLIQCGCHLRRWNADVGKARTHDHYSNKCPRGMSHIVGLNLRSNYFQPSILIDCRRGQLPGMSKGWIHKQNIFRQDIACMRLIHWYP